MRFSVAAVRKISSLSAWNRRTGANCIPLRRTMIPPPGMRLVGSGSDRSVRSFSGTSDLQAGNAPGAMPGGATASGEERKSHAESPADSVEETKKKREEAEMEREEAKKKLNKAEMEREEAKKKLDKAEIERKEAKKKLNQATEALARALDNSSLSDKIPALELRRKSAQNEVEAAQRQVDAAQRQVDSAVKMIEILSNTYTALLTRIPTGDDALKRETDEEKTNWANKMCKLEPEPVSLEQQDVDALNERGYPSTDPGVQVLRTESIIETEYPDVFVRPSTVDLFDRIQEDFNTTTKSPYAAVIGNPGIGKSRSIEYFLWRLLKEKKCVVLQGKAEVFIYTWRGDTYTVSIISVLKFDPVSCKELKDRDTWYLIDPAKRTEIVSVQARTVLFTSPMQSRYAEWLKEAEAGFFYAFPPDRSEILAMRTILAPEMSASEVLRRCDVVGPVPRYVFVDKTFDAQKKSMAGAANQIVGSSLGSIISNSEFILSDMSSKLICYFPPRQDSGGDFELSFISEHALALLMKELVKKLDSDSNAVDSKAFLMEKVFPAFCFPRVPIEFLPGGKLSFTQTYDMIASLPTKEEVDKMAPNDRTLFRVPKGFPMVDYVDACDRGYQVTTAAVHGIASTRFRESLDKAFERAGKGREFIDNHHFECLVYGKGTETRLDQDYVADAEAKRITVGGVRDLLRGS